MLNYLNTTFTFGKQTKDSFINRKFQCRPTYSFIHSFSCPLLTAFPLGRVAGTAALGGLEIPHNQQQSGWPVSSFGKERGRSSIPRRLFPWARNLALSSWANGGPDPSPIVPLSKEPSTQFMGQWWPKNCDCALWNYVLYHAVVSCSHASASPSVAILKKWGAKEKLGRAT